MGRQSRVDYVGAWLHVMVRALSKRPLFEGSADIRDFMACLAAAVRRGEIEVHAYAFVTTHVHLLVRSPRREVSRAFQRILSDYVRRYNRRRERDGPLLRGRFHSKVIRTDRYWMAVVRYIDRNPVEAGLLDPAGTLALSSRDHYARRSGPPWLCRGRIEATVSGLSGGGPYNPADYSRVFGSPVATEALMQVEGAVLRGDRPVDPFTDLLAAASPAVREWLERNAVLADGRRRVPMLASPALLQEVIDECRGREPSWTIRTERKERDGWQVVHVALLRVLSRESQESLVQRTRLTRSILRTLGLLHDKLMREDEEYARNCATAVSAVRQRLERAFPLIANTPPTPIGD